MSDWARVGIAPPKTTTYVDRGLAPGGSYTYRARAVNQYPSGWSNEVPVAIGAAP